MPDVKIETLDRNDSPKQTESPEPEIEDLSKSTEPEPEIEEITKQGETSDDSKIEVFDKSTGHKESDNQEASSIPVETFSHDSVDTTQEPEI